MKKPLWMLFVVIAFATPALGAGLQLSIQDGKVTLDAEDVTIRQILTEWGRVGNTRVVNVERLAGGPITLKFEGLPEKQALDTILRTVPGYVAAPRQAFLANASMYETILVMATTTAVAARPPAPASAFGGAPSPPFGGGFAGPGSVTQLRPAPVMPPPAVENPEPEQQEDPALTAAAAAGLIPGTGPAPVMPGAGAPPIALPLPGVFPGAVNQPPTPPAAAPLNPWNAPAGTPLPSLAAPPVPAATQPIARPRPPQADNK